MRIRASQLLLFYYYYYFLPLFLSYSNNLGVKI
jgi:hypothetical protein